MVDLLAKTACFLKKRNIYNECKSSRSELVRKRRSIVLILSLQQNSLAYLPKTSKTKKRSFMMPDPDLRKPARPPQRPQGSHGSAVQQDHAHHLWRRGAGGFQRPLRVLRFRGGIPLKILQATLKQHLHSRFCSASCYMIWQKQFF